MKKSLLILNYHQIIEDNKLKESTKLSRFSVTQTDFISQIRLIKSKNIPIVSLSDWVKNNCSDGLSILLTFDDGNKSDYEIVYKTLKKEKVTATFFPILSKINTKNGINWSQLKEMADNGFIIGSHGVNHLNLLKLSEKESSFELEESKKRIEDNINHNVCYLSLPFGMYNSKILALSAQAKYHIVLSTRVKLNAALDSFLLHRLNMKRNISLGEFEKIISLNKRVIKRKKIISSVSFLVKKRLNLTEARNLINKSR